jgi:hypothetical protein
MNTSDELELSTLLNIARSIQSVGHSTTFKKIKEHMECIDIEILKLVPSPSKSTLKGYQSTAHLKDIEIDFDKILDNMSELEDQIKNLQNILTATPYKKSTQVAINDVFTIAAGGNNILSNLHQEFLNHACEWLEEAIEQHRSTADEYPLLHTSSEEDTSTSHD